MCLTSDGPHRGKVGGLHEQSRTPFSGPTRSCDVGRPLERKKSKAAFMMEEEWRRKLEAEARRQLDEERQLASHDMAIPVERVTSLSWCELSLSLVIATGKNNNHLTQISLDSRLLRHDNRHFDLCRRLEKKKNVRSPSQRALSNGCDDSWKNQVLLVFSISSASMSREGASATSAFFASSTTEASSKD
jgi:hypothetical protein